MMKLSRILPVLLSIQLSSAPAWAFIPKTDPVKGASGLSNIIQKGLSETNKAMETISNSKMGTLVGDGVKATKDAGNFVADQYSQAMEMYGKAQKAVDDAKNSNEYKAALLSKEIAAVSAQLASKQKQLKRLQEDTAQQIEIIENNRDRKQADLNQNLELNPGLKAQSEVLQKEIDEFDAEIAALKQKESKESASLEDEMVKLTAKLEKLTKELAALNKKAEKDSGGAKDGAEAFKEVKEEAFLKPDEEPTLKNRQDLLEKRYEGRRESIYNAYQKGIESKTTLTGTRKKVEMTVDTGAAMPGESETSGVNTEVLIQHAEALRQYVDMILWELEMETAVELAQLPKIESADRLENFNLCKYSLEYGQSKSGLAALKDKAGAVKETLSKAKSQADSAIQKAKEAKEMADGLQEAVSSAGEIVKSKTSEISGVEGMM